MPMNDYLILILIAAGTTGGFALLFNVRGWNILLAAAAGGLGNLVFQAILYSSGTDPLAYFLAALTIGTYAEIIGPMRSTTPSVFIACAIIPLVPGYMIYETMLHAINEQMDGMLLWGVKSFLAAGALGVGIALAVTIAALLQRQPEK